MNDYEIVDTRVCLDSTQAISVRLNVTVNQSKRHAIQWLWSSARITDFSGSRDQCEKVNQFVVDLLVPGDKELLAQMNAFVEPYTI